MTFRFDHAKVRYMNWRKRQDDIYSAEHTALSGRCRVFESNAAAEDWLADVCERHSLIVPNVRWGNSRKGQDALASSDTIMLPSNDFGRDAATILHELAHTVVGDGHGHDGVWLSRYLDLIRREIGIHHWAALRHDLKENGIPC